MSGETCKQPDETSVGSLSLKFRGRETKSTSVIVPTSANNISSRFETQGLLLAPERKILHHLWRITTYFRGMRLGHSVFIDVAVGR